MAEDDFELWLGRIASDRPFAHQLRKAANLAGGARRSSGARARRFDGSRIGRGPVSAGFSHRRTGSPDLARAE